MINWAEKNFMLALTKKSNWKKYNRVIKSHKIPNTTAAQYTILEDVVGLLLLSLNFEILTRCGQWKYFL